MKRTILRRLMKKSVAFAMASVMMVTCVGTLAVPKKVEAKSWLEDFETNLAGWKLHNGAEFSQRPDNSNNKALKISQNQIGWGNAELDLQLKPNTAYVMTAKVKGENITVDDKFSDGVYIDVVGGTAYALDYVNAFQTKSFDWTTMQVYFYTSSRGNVRIYCGMNETSGTVYFDDVCIKEYTYTDADKDKRIIGETEKIRLSLTAARRISIRPLSLPVLRRSAPRLVSLSVESA